VGRCAAAAAPDFAAAPDYAAGSGVAEPARGAVESRVVALPGVALAERFAAADATRPASALPAASRQDSALAVAAPASLTDATTVVGSQAAAVVPLDQVQAAA
jgi:hypothetical protein